MIFKIITALILGITVGIHIKVFNENKTLEAFEELITIYEAHEEELKDKVNYYKNGMLETLEQNIELKKKLNKGKSIC